MHTSRLSGFLSPMWGRLGRLMMMLACVTLFAGSAIAADPPTPDPKKDEKKEPEKPDPAKTPAMQSDINDVKASIDTINGEGIHKYADMTWLLVSSALVMFMMPGLALFYGGMTRRKNVLGTMMHTMAALGLVGVQWICFGYSLSFGEPFIKIAVNEIDSTTEKDDKGAPKKVPNKLGFVGFSKELLMLNEKAAVGVEELKEDKAKEEVAKENPTWKDDSDDFKKAVTTKIEDNKKARRFMKFPNTNVPLYLHAMFQGMFAIITVALVSGAFAERVKFLPYCLFALLWTTIVYDPLAHMVWSFEWGYLASHKAPNDTMPAAGLFGGNGAIDFAGGTVVHIAAGFAGLAAILVLRKRHGYGKVAIHPNSILLTLLGAGMLWFGWFGFNGGSALFANGQAISAFTVTQIAAATAGVVWMIVEWIHRGKPTALGFASGLVAGLVAITPASGFVAPCGALIIGVASGIICYLAVAAKGLLGYDDSLDAFGIHGVGGFLGAILTGALVSMPLWIYGSELKPNQFPGKIIEDSVTKAVTFDMSAQISWQLAAALTAAVYSFVVTGILVFIIDKTIGFTLKAEDEQVGLDLSQHGEVGIDVGPEVDGMALEPKTATAPPGATGAAKRFTVIVDGADPKKLHTVWAEMCKPADNPPKPEFSTVYQYLTTVSGNKFRFSGGDPVAIQQAVTKLFSDALSTAVKAKVE